MFLLNYIWCFVFICFYSFDKILQAINDQIMSVDYQNSKIQILTADSQASLKNAVVTLVAGLVIGKDGERKSFTQSFFLVPQNGSYFVLNDVFRYVSDVFVEPEATKEVEIEESPKETVPGKCFQQIKNLGIYILEHCFDSHVYCYLTSRACK